MKTQLVWGHVERPWGYEVRVDLEHDGAIRNEVLTFAARPADDVLAARVEALRAGIEEREAARLAAEAEALAEAEFNSLVGL